MKLIIQNKSGDASNLMIKEFEKPTSNENELLIEVNMVNIASGNMRINTLEDLKGIANKSNKVCIF